MLLPALESLLWASVLYEHLHCGSFSWTTVLHKLFWYGSLRFHMSYQDMLCMDSSLWPAVPARICSSRASPQAAPSFKAHPPALGPPQGALGSLLHWGPHSLQGDSCLTMDCRRLELILPFFFSELVICIVVSHKFSFFSIPSPV